MGRNRVPDEIKRIRGNPGRRPLATDAPPAQPDSAADVSPAGAPLEGEVEAPAKPPSWSPPEWLTDEREQLLFSEIVAEFLPQNLVRSTDFNLLGRYATLMHQWIKAKEDFGRIEAEAAKVGACAQFVTIESKHGKRTATHPLLKLMTELNSELRMMEPQLALTPLARHVIMARLQSYRVPTQPTQPGELPLDQPPQAEQRGALDWFETAPVEGNG